MRPRLLAALLGLALLVVAGCGGGTKVYTADATRACLQKSGVDVVPVPKDDFIASSAEGGAFTARFRDNKVTISFGLDRAGAGRIVHAYDHFKGANIGLADVLRPKHNAVMLWALHPPDAYLTTIEDCLK